MRKIVAAIAAVVACSALAGDELVWKGDGVSVRFTLAACGIAQLEAALIANDAQAPIRAASVHQGDSEVPACWGALGEDKVLIIDIFGRGGFLMRKDLKPNPGV